MMIYTALLIACIQFSFKKIKDKINDLLFRIAPYRALCMTKQIAQWSRLIGMMLPTGVPLIEALQIANRMIMQPHLQQQMQNVRKGVIKGESLHAALNHCPHFPKRAKYLISIGENADALDVMMQRLSMLYQKKFETTLDHLSKLLEPVIMIGVASLISGLIIAMYLPIFRMGSVI
jgi:type IV pilus assembly protein PilC